MKSFARFTASFVLGSALIAGPFATARAQQEIRFSSFVPPVHVIAKEIIAPWIQDVAKATNGQVKVTFYPSMQLGGKPPDLFRQAVDGVVDMVFTLPGYTSPAFPRTQMIELPGLKEDGIAATHMMWDLLDEFLGPEYQGVKVIALWGAEDAGLMMRGKALRTLAEVKGKRMRAPSAAQASQLQRMGAVPIAMPITDLYQSLERGVVDGAMVPFSTIVDFRLGEVAKGYVIAGPQFGRSSFAIVMNRKKYDSLSPAQRAAIDKLSGRELSVKATKVYMARTDQGLASVKGKAEIVRLSAEEERKINAALRPIVGEWVKESEGKGIPARAMLKRAGYKGL